MDTNTSPPEINTSDNGVSLDATADTVAAAVDAPDQTAAVTNEKKAFYQGRYKPKVGPVNFDAIPSYLHQFTAWVEWKLRYSDAKNEWTKPLYRPSGWQARNNRPTDWTTFENVKAAYLRSQSAKKVGDRFDGVGFCFWPDTSPEYDLLGLDLDNVRNRETGELVPWAKELVANLDALGAYIDISPSGTGLKVIVRGKWNGSDRKRTFDDGTELQVFTKGYFTLTGDNLTGKDGIPEAQAVLDELAPLFVKKAKKKPVPTAGDNKTEEAGSSGTRQVPAGVTNDVILAKAREDGKFVDLYDTDSLCGYGTPSEADAALFFKLAFYCGGDAARVEQLARGSKRRRDKWDGRRRDSTWLKEEIARAVAEVSEVYDWSQVTVKWGNDTREQAPEPKSEAAPPDEQPVAGKPGDQRPIVFTTVDIHLMADTVRNHLSKVKRLYSRGRVLVQEMPESPGRLYPVTLDAMPELLSRHERFVTKVVKQTGEVELKQVAPPPAACKSVFSNPAAPIPEVENVVTYPVMLADGRILSEPGYDPESKTLVRLSAGLTVNVPDNPTQEDARRAAEVLLEPFSEFPFVDEDDEPTTEVRGKASRSGVLAIILALVARPAINSPCPMTLVTKNSPGTGGSLLLEAIGLLVTGEPFPVYSYTDDKAEMGKLIATLAIEGHPVAHLDNLTGEVGGSELNKTITARKGAYRVLGSSKTFTGTLNTVFVGSGNNCTLGADMPRRVQNIRMRVFDERPEERKFSRNLREYIPANRGRLLSAALTILKAYIVAGRPKPETDLPSWGMFEGYTAVVRQSLVYAGQADPYKPVAGNGDHRKRMLKVLAFGMREMDEQGKGMTAAEIVRRLRDDAYLPETLQLAYDALSEIMPHVNSVSLGKILATEKDRNLGGVVITESPNRHRTNMAMWVANEIPAKPKPDHQEDKKPPASPANNHTDNDLFAGDAGDKTGSERSRVEPWTDADEMFSALTRAGKRWPDAVLWLNETHGAKYPANTGMAHLSVHHKKLIHAWLVELAANPGVSK